MTSRSDGRIVVEVPLGERSYPIEIGSGTLDQLGPALREQLGASQAFVVTVPPVAKRHAPSVERSLKRAGIAVKRLIVPDGERSKNLRQAERLYDALLAADAERSSVLIALGGGVVGDLTGFVAATLLRGVRFVQVPTTLLAMIDSSVGGKTGVNVRRGKNLVGAFHQPSLVWIDAATLRTLPRRELLAGLAEGIKHAAILDGELFASLEEALERLIALDPDVLLPFLARNCAIKAGVVSRDERESDERMLLNFGHTLGHAVEALSRYQGVLHGEAVAMGMAFAARRSEELGLAKPGTAMRLIALLARAGLPTELPAFPRRAYLATMSSDKKKQGGQIRFVALREIGRAETVPLCPSEILPPTQRGARR
jgi:3-dehydroquinate synthase